MTAPAARAGLWFRCDLRLDDNPALQAAVRNGAALLPLYVFDPSRFNTPSLAGARKSSARRARFLLESVACLRRRLEAKGSGLLVGLGRADEILPKFCHGFEAVYLQQTVCSEEQREEAKVSRHLGTCKLHRVWGGTLFLPEDCGQAPDKIPSLFTSFKNKAESRGQIRHPVDAPRQMPGLPPLDDEGKTALSYLPTLQDLGYGEVEAQAAGEDDPRGVMRFEGGEEAALHRLKKWMWDNDKLKEYFEIRNGMLGEGYSSKFSPWLAAGCLSPRRIWLEAQRYEAERVKNKSTYWLIFELEWRDFFIYLANSYGNQIFMRGGLTGEKWPWSGTQDALQKWREGRTGDQLVDANMRELAATGWMSNRGRQNVASYLIFDLGCDWRHGAAHFEELLLDYDPCSNWGNWVAAAGLTGNRVNKFNTKKQLNDYDPDRTYVRHWLQGGAPRPVAAVGRGDGGADIEVDEEAKKRQARLERFGAKGAANSGAASEGGRVWQSGKGTGKGKADSGSRQGAGRDGGEGGKRGRWRRAEEPQ